MSLEGLHQLAVENPMFRLSRTRATIMRGFWILIGILQRHGIPGEVWVDGSFLTEKIDPRDVDILLVLPVGVVDTMTNEQYAIMQWISDTTNQESKALFYADTYVLSKSDGSDGNLAAYLEEPTAAAQGHLPDLS